MAGASTLCRDLGELRIEGVKVHYDTVLGRGGYGKVYKAELANGTQAAAKELLPDSLSAVDNSAVAKFVDECRLLKELSERNPRYIVRFYGVYYPPAQSQYAAQQPQLPLLIMELMETSLNDYVSRSSSRNNRRGGTQIPSSILHDVAEGLKLLHSKRLVHRDLTPRNVLLRGGERGGVIAKISDLGVSRMISGSETDLTHCPGARRYMPPEVFCQPPVYNEKLDIYSFGMLMLYLLTQNHPPPPEPPYDRPTARQILPMVKSHQLFPLIERCLAKHPEHRPTAVDILGYLKTGRNKFKPSWQELIPGLCVRGLCTNEECIAYGEVICSLGFVRFNLGTDSPKLKCSECYNHIGPVEFVFHQCTGEGKGKIWSSFSKPEEKVHGQFQPEHRITINPGPNGGNWSSLIVEARCN